MKVPAILDTDAEHFTLGESHAIMRYLCRKYQAQCKQFYPIDNFAKCAKIDEYLDFHHTNTRKITHYISNTVFANRLNTFDHAYDAQKAKKEVESVMGKINEIYFLGKDYVCG